MKLIDRIERSRSECLKTEKIILADDGRRALTTGVDWLAPQVSEAKKSIRRLPKWIRDALHIGIAGSR